MIEQSVLAPSPKPTQPRHVPLPHLSCCCSSAAMRVCLYCSVRRLTWGRRQRMGSQRRQRMFGMLYCSAAKRDTLSAVQQT